MLLPEPRSPQMPTNDPAAAVNETPCTPGGTKIPCNHQKLQRGGESTISCNIKRKGESCLAMLKGREAKSRVFFMIIDAVNEMR